MAAPVRTIEAITFDPNGIRIQFMSSTDVRAEGEIFQAHTVAISWANEALRDLVKEVEEAADRLLGEAITTWASSRPFDIEADRQQMLDDNDDDTDEGLGN